MSQHDHSYSDALSDWTEHLMGEQQYNGRLNRLIFWLPRIHRIRLHRQHDSYHVDIVVAYSLIMPMDMDQLKDAFLIPCS